MGSTFILKFRLCLEPIKPFSTLKTSLCKSHASARSLSTRDPHSSPGAGHPDRRTSTGQGESRYGYTRHREDELWKGLKGKSAGSGLRQRPSVPKSVFAAGTAKRTADLLRRKAGTVSEDEEPDGARIRKVKQELPDQPLSVSEWKQLKESSGDSRFDTRMMTAIINSKSELDIAKSLLTFVATETGSLPYDLLLRYLTLCVSGNHDSEVSDVYDIMLGSFPTLETGASSLFIKSFSRTERWREALEILHRLKKVVTPSTRNYSQVISGAVLHGDVTTAWALYDELMEKDLKPLEETWVDLFKGPARKTKVGKGEGPGSMSEAEHHERLLGILLHMRNNQIYPGRDFADTIKTWFERQTDHKWRGNWTSTNPKGVCRCCGSQLETIDLTDEEYKQLRDRVMTDIIQGEDVFNKTTPQELQTFKSFVEKKPAFDVVIDGLNVANISRDKSKLSEVLLAVVLGLQSQGRTLLVLGRKHMLRPTRSWQKHHMDQIQQMAHCFFAENISEDDPFLLYATLHSGNHCKFVSRDLMRDHKACLPDDTTRRLFFKWQRGHQLVVGGYVELGRRVRFQSILSYDTIIQTAADSWHLPYDDTEDRSTYEVPQRWLCLTKKP